MYSANEFLTRINLMKAYRTDSKHAHHSTGEDGGRSGRRQRGHGRGPHAPSAWEPRRSTSSTAAGMEELPARKEEVEHAEEEGIIFKTAVQPCGDPA